MTETIAEISREILLIILAFDFVARHGAFDSLKASLGRIRRLVVKRLKKNKRFMVWLNSEPQNQMQTVDECGKIEVRNDWRERYVSGPFEDFSRFI